MSLLDTVLAQARLQIGKPYVYGDEGPSSFDCSGLMQYVFGLAGISLPRTAAAQQASAKVVKVTDPQPGDLVFYGNPAHHVALYIGGGRQIAAPHTGALVQEQGVSSGATYGRVNGAGTASGALGLTNVGASVLGVSLDVDKLTRQVQGTATTVAVGLLGLALVGAGVWMAVAPKAKAALKEQLGNTLGA